MESNATLKEMKIKSIEIMKEMNIYKPYLNDYKSKDIITYFIKHIGFYITEQNDIYRMLKKNITEIEEKYGVKVYSVIESYQQNIKLHSYNYLIVPNFKEDWDYTCNECNVEFKSFKENKKIPKPKLFNVLAYVQNLDYPELSELGTITVSAFLGGLDRVY